MKNGILKCAEMASKYDCRHPAAPLVQDATANTCRLALDAPLFVGETVFERCASCTRRNVIVDARERVHDGHIGEEHGCWVALVAVGEARTAAVHFFFDWGV